ncbi:hypothetical protein POTOM_031340 [Populus tomentosa]|uniref:Plastocyanin-like domain-containing protein n=1 Tax=Populus tomentosa TaxID=118781 RepID=A0A8X7ZCG5_POPTO|nr:hypothetical protein POTOM_031340 [Populus tomentosa]
MVPRHLPKHVAAKPSVICDICTTKGRDSCGWVLGIGIGLIVHKSLREHKHVTKLKSLSVEFICGVYEADLKDSIDNEKELRRTWMGVRWVDCTCRALSKKPRGSVKVKKSPPIFVEEFAGITKSVMIFGSLAVTNAKNVTKRTVFSKAEAMGHDMTVVEANGSYPPTVPTIGPLWNDISSKIGSKFCILGSSSAFDQCPPPDGKELANFDIYSVAKNINGTSSNRIYSLWFNSTVGVVLQNANTVTANNSETHSGHLHRHDFWALGCDLLNENVNPGSEGKVEVVMCFVEPVTVRKTGFELRFLEALNSMANTNDAEATGEENSRVDADDDEETEDVSALNTNR